MHFHLILFILWKFPVEQFFPLQMNKKRNKKEVFAHTMQDIYDKKRKKDMKLFAQKILHVRLIICDTMMLMYKKRKQK